MPRQRSKTTSVTHPIVRIIHQEMTRREMSQQELADLAGINWQTINYWRRGGGPNVKTLEYVLDVFGYELRAVKVRKQK